MDGVDCWGLVKLVQAQVFGRDVPDYADAYQDGDDWEGISRAVRDGLCDGWARTEEPREGDLLVLSIAGRPWHCGVMVSSIRFLHAPPDASSVIERLDTPRWARRIEGIYRYG